MEKHRFLTEGENPAMMQPEKEEVSYGTIMRRQLFRLQK